LEKAKMSLVAYPGARHSHEFESELLLELLEVVVRMFPRILVSMMLGIWAQTDLADTVLDIVTNLLLNWIE
jgi:hypothetical protein